MDFQRDVWRSAQLLIKKHGEDAATIAAQKADSFGAKSDTKGLRVWIDILHAIQWLQDDRGRDPFRVEH